MKFMKSLRTAFLQDTSTLMAASGSKQRKPMKTYTESLSCRKKKLDTEATTRGVLSKKVFLKISQNSQENSCARLSFLIKLQVLGLRPAALLKKKLWYRRFPVNLAKFLRTTFLQNTVGRLLPDIPERYF